MCSTKVLGLQYTTFLYNNNNNNNNNNILIIIYVRIYMYIYNNYKYSYITILYSHVLYLSNLYKSLF